MASDGLRRCSSWMGQQRDCGGLPRASVRFSRCSLAATAGRGGARAGRLSRDRARPRTQLRDEAPRPHAPPCGRAGAPARRDHALSSTTTSARQRPPDRCQARPRGSSPGELGDGGRYGEDGKEDGDIDADAPPRAAPSVATAARRRRLVGWRRGFGGGALAAAHRSASSALTSSVTPAAGSWRSSRRSASRRPPRSRSARSPCSAANSLSAATRRARTRPGRRFRAMGVESIRELARCRSPGAATRPRAPGPPRTHGCERRVEVALRALGHSAEVGLRHHEQVGHLHDPGLQELEDVARGRLHHHGHGVAHLLDVGLRLAHAHSLDHHDVEGRGERLGGLAGGGGESAEAAARGGRADQHAVVIRVVVDPRTVAEQRAAGALARRIHRENRHGLSRCATPSRASTGVSIYLPRGAGYPDDVGRWLALERCGRDLT